jgi:hypothetical protein
VSAHAFTCDDVRALSLGQRAYYIKVLSITPAQQERIRRECFKPDAAAPTGYLGRREQEVIEASHALAVETSRRLLGRFGMSNHNVKGQPRTASVRNPF